MSRLTWPDLLIEDISSDQFRDWLAAWAGVVSGRVAAAFLSKFGFWFHRRLDGHVEMLDVFTRHLDRAANSYDEFMREVNEPWWQEVHLLSELVLQLHAAGRWRDRASATRWPGARRAEPGQRGRRRSTVRRQRARAGGPVAVDCHDALRRRIAYP